MNHAIRAVFRISILAFILSLLTGAAWGQPTKRIEIKKCNDSDGSGVCNESSYLSDWNFTIYYPIDSYDVNLDPDLASLSSLQATTGSDGTTVVYIPIVGPDERIMICEAVQGGWELTGVEGTGTSFPPEFANAGKWENCTVFLGSNTTPIMVTFNNDEYSATRTITLRKCHDEDGDGNCNDDTTGLLEGWDFTVYYPVEPEGQVYNPANWESDSGTTGLDGTFSLTDIPVLDTGFRIMVCETLKSGWALTGVDVTAANGAALAAGEFSESAYDYCATFFGNFTSDETVTLNNAPTKQITIRKCKDDDESDDCDEETGPLLSEWNYTVYYPVGASPGSWNSVFATTGGDGTVTVVVPVVSTDEGIMICESVKGGWTLTDVVGGTFPPGAGFDNYPNCTVLDGDDNATETVDFINEETTETLSFNIKKCHDKNGDSKCADDTGDLIVDESWEFTIWYPIAPKGQDDPGNWDSRVVTTGDNGIAPVTDLPVLPDKFRIMFCETVKEGWGLTGASDGTPATPEFSGYDNCMTLEDDWIPEDQSIFMNNATIGLTIHKCEDADGDGTCDDDETGLADWHYTVYYPLAPLGEDQDPDTWKTMTKTTAGDDGKVSLNVPILDTGQRVMICETVKAGWKLTGFAGNVTPADYDSEFSGYDNCATFLADSTNPALPGTVTFNNQEPESNTHTITIRKCEDKNGNGNCADYVNDLLEGWEFTVYYPIVPEGQAYNPANWNPLPVDPDEIITGPDGTVSLADFPILDDGFRVMVCETVKSGWALTGASGGAALAAGEFTESAYENCATFKGDSSGDQTVTMNNAEYPKVKVVKYEDPDGDGSSGTNTPKADWTFYLERSDGGGWVVDDNCTTEPDGACEMTMLSTDPHTYRVREDVGDWILTEVRTRWKNSSENRSDNKGCSSYDLSDTSEEFVLDSLGSAATVEMWNWPPPACPITAPDPVCAGDIVAVSVSASDSGNFDCTKPYAYAWSGDGAFSDPGIADPNWTASATGGTATLSVTVTYGSNSQGQCADSVDVEVVPVPTANAGPDQTVCSYDTSPLNGQATNYGSIVWSGGLGTFDPNANTLNPVYTPHESEIGTVVTLTLTAVAIVPSGETVSPCANAMDTVDITVKAPLNCEITPDEASQDGIVEPLSSHTASVTPVAGATYEWYVKALVSDGELDLITSVPPFGHSIDWTAPEYPVNIVMNVRITDADGCICEYDPPFDMTIGVTPTGMLFRVYRYIPSLTSWGILCVAGLLGAVGLTRMRRKRSR
ncbi:MAG: hypothetical protein JRK53_08890 [Deltaproteobacteria bacterium]|nr:hypothetical protein [Deltaproteobacteria bacterium]MBW1817199.1 hypothetical protein [Deltaproteobacteria bacterium]